MAAPAYQTGSTQTGVASNTLVFTDPGTANWLLFVVVTSDSSTETWTAPAGWEAALFNDTTTLDGHRTTVFYRKLAVGSGTYTFTLSADIVARCGALVAISGHDTTTPVDVSNKTIANTGDASPTDVAAPSVTTTVADTLILHVGALDPQDGSGTAYSWAAPASYTLRQSVTQTWSSCAVSTITQAAAGATGIATAVATRSGSTAARFGYHIAIKAAAAAAASDIPVSPGARQVRSNGIFSMAPPVWSRSDGEKIWSQNQKKALSFQGRMKSIGNGEITL